MTNGGQAAGWHPDPYNQAPRRWWDGEQWTEHTDGVLGSGPDPGSVAAPAYTAPAYAAPAYAPTMAPPGASDLSLDAHRNLLWVIVGGVAVVLLGSFLPWATVSASFLGEVTVSGMDGDGVLTLLGGAVAGGLALSAFLGRAARWKVVTALVFAVLVALVALIDIVDINSRVADLEGEGLGAAIDVSIGIGLWLTLLGGIATVVGCALTLPKLRRS